MSEKILFVGDKSHWSETASLLISQCYPNVKKVFWEYGDVFPEELNDWKGDLIISFKSDLYLSEIILSNCKKFKVNIHPAPPKYRGIGGYYYSINNGDKEYGVTVHHMDAEIDHGNIIEVLEFPIDLWDNPETIKEKAAVYCLIALTNLLRYLFNGMSLPSSKIEWFSKLYTRKELDVFKLNKNLYLC